MFKINFRLLLLVSILVFAISNAVFAEERYPEIRQADSGNDFVYLTDGRFQTVNKDAILNILNEIRKEAYEEGLASSYVPLKWSTNLEYSSQIRSVEASITMHHKRLTDKTIWTAHIDRAYGGVAENLAWNSNANTIERSIEQYYGEKANYIRFTNGEAMDPNKYGHYKAMINPDFKYVGMAGFITSNPREFNSSTQLFATDVNGGEEVTGFYGQNNFQIVEVKKSMLSQYNVERPKNTINVDETLGLKINAKLTYTNEDGTVIKDVVIKDIIWSSSDNEIATVDRDGNVKGIKAGNVVITASIGSEVVATQSIVVASNTNTNPQNPSNPGGGTGNTGGNTGGSSSGNTGGGTSGGNTGGTGGSGSTGSSGGSSGGASGGSAGGGAGASGGSAGGGAGASGGSSGGGAGGAGLNTPTTTTTTTVTTTPTAEPPTNEALVQSVFAINRKSYLVGGQAKTLVTAPFIKNGRTMLPVRAIAESLGLSSSWDNVTKTATFKNAQKTAVVKMGQSIMTVNNIPVQLSVPAEVKDGSVMIELRSLANAFGVKILWNNAEKTITVN